MSQSSEKKPLFDSNRLPYTIGLGLALGLIGGMLLGNLAIGLVVGALIGLAAGVYLEQYERTR